MITEKYKILSDYTEEERKLIEKGYKDFFQNKNYFNLIHNEIGVIEYIYDTYRVFVLNNADIVVINNNTIQTTLFTCEIGDIKVDNKNNLLCLISSDFDMILIDFKDKKVYNSKEF